MILFPSNCRGHDFYRDADALDLARLLGSLRAGFFIARQTLDF